MAQSATLEGVDQLEQRLSRGAELLFDMERRGDLGPEYERWIVHWISLLAEYEASTD